MGYHTEFEGEFRLDKPLSKEHADYLRKFNETRRMARSEELTAKRPDPIREAVALPVGRNGCFFVGECGSFGQGSALVCTSCNNIETNAGFYRSGPKDCPKCGNQMMSDITDYNQPPGMFDVGGDPGRQPSLWCQWTPNEDSTAIEWDFGEKFYSYVEWLEYIIKYFLKPWGYTLNGEVRYRGDDFDDLGTIVVEDNEVSRCHGDF